jgi:hypothetical protein
MLPRCRIWSAFQRYNRSMRKYGVGLALLAVGLGAVGYLWLPHQKKVSASVAPASQQATTPATKAPGRQPIDAPAAIVQELANLRPGLTVAEWRLSHPNDTWYKPTYEDQLVYAGDYPGQLDNLNFRKACATSTGTVELPDGSSATRKAVFYLPAPPVPLALPENASASGLVDTCTIAYLETRLMTQDSGTRATLDGKVQSTLTARYGGPANEDAEVAEQVSRGRWPKTLVWKQGGAKTVIGRIDTVESPDTLFSVYSYLPSFRYERREHLDNLYGLTPYDVPKIFGLAMRTAALDAKLSKPMNDFFQEWGQPKENGRRVQARRVIDVLRSWLQASSTLSPQRRAAALLAGQFVFEAFVDRVNDEKVDFESIDFGEEMKSMGVEFDPGEGGLHPGHAWIKEARELNPDGPIGDAIALMSLANWWVDGVDEYFAIAEKYLSQQHGQDSTAWTEYFLASAYQNIVILGHTGGEEPEIPPSMKPTQEQIEAGAAAKTQAIKHYRAVLAIDADKNSWKALLAWRTAWKLMADLPVWDTQ